MKRQKIRRQCKNKIKVTISKTKVQLPYKITIYHKLKPESETRKNKK